jgi:pyrroline-5-carboxylate reductase
MTISENVGFIGSGGIATAMARGLLKAPGFTGSIYLSVHKNAARAEAVQALAPERVVLTGSNQEIIDKTIFVVPALLPKVLEEVAPKLKFRRENHIIHITAFWKLAAVASWYAPACGLVRSVPLPFSADRMGPVVVYGDDEEGVALLSQIGSVVRVKTEKDLETLAALTGMMDAYYGAVAEMVGWCETKGMDFQSALDYATEMNEALSVHMRRNCTEDVETFLRENATPGGTNELGLKTLREAQAYKPWSEALEKIGKRYGI